MNLGEEITCMRNHFGPIRQDSVKHTIMSNQAAFLEHIDIS